MQNPSDSKFLRNLDWNLLKTFAEIVRSGGVSKAALVMSRQQPSVSSALKRLEDYLGVVLCHRGPSGFQLTENGKALVEICNVVEEQILSLPGTFDEISNELMFQIRLLVVGNLVSKRLDVGISNFSQQYPRAEILINVAACTEIEDKLIHHDAEIGVAPVAGSNPKLRYDLLYREQHIPFCGRKHHHYGKNFKHPNDLINEAFITPNLDEAEQVRAYRKKYGWGSSTVGQSDDLNEIKRMVHAGLGIAVLPIEYVQKEIEVGSIWPLMKPQPELQDNIYIITSPENHRNIAISKFLGLIFMDDIQ